MSEDHPGISCDVCDSDNIVGVRFVCLVCDDYDLCGECNDEHKFNLQHKPYHPMQALFLKPEYLDGIDINEINLFCCPYCGLQEFNGFDLMVHCERYHSRGGYEVRCPICLVFGLNRGQRLTTTLSQHLSDFHWEYLRQECAVCVENMEFGQRTRRLECKHRYHADCISSWFQINPTCPQCRFVVSQDISC